MAVVSTAVGCTPRRHGAGFRSPARHVESPTYAYNRERLSWGMHSPPPSCAWGQMNASPSLRWLDDRHQSPQSEPTAKHTVGLRAITPLSATTSPKVPRSSLGHTVDAPRASLGQSLGPSLGHTVPEFGSFKSVNSISSCPVGADYLSYSSTRGASPSQVPRILAPAVSTATATSASVMSKLPSPSLSLVEVPQYVAPSPVPTSTSPSGLGCRAAQPSPLNSQVNNSQGAFKFYGPHDLVEDPGLLPPRGLGSFGVTGTISPPAPSPRRQQSLASRRDSNVAAPPPPRDRWEWHVPGELQTDPLGVSDSAVRMPPKELTQSSLGSTEYGPVPTSNMDLLGRSLGATRQDLAMPPRVDTMLPEECALRAPPPPLPDRLADQIEELIEAQKNMREELQAMRGHTQGEAAEMEVIRSIPPPPDAVPYSWTGPSLPVAPTSPPGSIPPPTPAETVDLLAAARGSGLPSPQGSYHLPHSASHALSSSPGTGARSPCSPSPGGFPRAGSFPPRQSSFGGTSPRAASPPPQVERNLQHTRLRNLGYHDNMETLNTVTTHMSTRARALHSQWRATSPGSRKNLRECC